MNRHSFYTVLLSLIVILLAVNLVFTISPLKKEEEVIKYIGYGYDPDYVNPRDYQIDISEEYIEIYDEKRYVGSVSFKSSLGRIILRDNQ
jgi:hypothetical protein